MAISERECCFACRASISSPMRRASSSESHAPVIDDLLAGLVLRAQRLAEAALVLGDQARGGGEDVAGRAVIALQADDRRAGKIVLEAQDVVDLGAAPAVDRLVVVADAAEVLARLREQPQPEILRDVGVLVLVDQHVAEAVSGTAPGCRGARARGAGTRAAGRRNRRRSASSAAPDRPRRACRPCRWRRRRPRPPGPGRARARGFSSRRSWTASWRAGQRFSSIFSAAMTCFISRSWSSVPRIVKSERRPTSSAWRRRILVPIEWNVPSHCMPSATGPIEGCDTLLHLARGLVGEGHRRGCRRDAPCRSR